MLNNLNLLNALIIISPYLWLPQVITMGHEFQLQYLHLSQRTL